MKYEELIILLPCHSLEDFPLYHEGDDAEGLLAGWSAMWHPALLASAQALPTWHRVDDPPEALANRLLIVPSVSSSELPTGFAQRAEQEGACLIRKITDRSDIVSLALEPLKGGRGGVSDTLVADFLALGFCFLQVELLTRQMRYASNLDEIHFKNQAVAAATAAMEGNETQARERLTACFDVLAEERDHYYPVDAYVLDVTMVAPSTIGPALRNELGGDRAINLLISAESLSAMADKEPQSLLALQQAIRQQRVGLIGGETNELRWPLLSCETILDQLRRGGQQYRNLLGQSPHVYGRRRFGLSPILPQILHKLGFRGALHATLDEGRFPEATQLKTRWEGSDGAVIDAIARAPQNANLPESFLGYAVKLGESMDTDHVATICLAHWPGRHSPWLDDLRRVASYCQALGKFVTVNEYFRDTDIPGHVDRFEADQYRSPFLKQAIVGRQADPISRLVRYWRRRAMVEAQQSLSALACLVSGAAPYGASELAAEVDRLEEHGDENRTESIDERLSDSLAKAAARFSECLPRSDDEPTNGCLVVNPSSFVRRIPFESRELTGLPTIAKPIYSASESDGLCRVVADVPPMGFVWVTPGETTAAPMRPPPPLVQEYLLRNEFFEVNINPTTGALQSLHEYGDRNNRLSQQLAFRLPDKGARPGSQMGDSDNMGAYSVMAADSFDVVHSDSTKGEIVVAGRLLDREGNTLADYRQTYRIWRGSRVLLLDIELEPRQPPRADPWNSYFAARCAWRDESASLWRSVQQTRQPTDLKRIEAPHYIDIESVDPASPIVQRLRGETPPKRTTILTGGLTFHRRIGLRMLDSLLIVQGETQRKFQMGVGIDLASPAQAASELLSPTIVLPQSAPPPAPSSSGWLFHIDSKNVVATHWEPLPTDQGVGGYRVRLLETAGKSARVTLSGFRKVTAARQVDFLGEPLGECQIPDGNVRLELAANEWAEVEANW